MRDGMKITNAVWKEVWRAENELLQTPGTRGKKRSSSTCLRRGRMDRVEDDGQKSMLSEKGRVEERMEKGRNTESSTQDPGREGGGP